MAKDRRKLIHIHSNLVDKQPTPESLEVGEIAVNNSAGNEFLSTKNSDGEVVRFSTDETLIKWDEIKAVFPYKGSVEDVDLAKNKSNIELSMNQCAAALSPKSNEINNARDINGNPVNPSTDGGATNGAGIAIDMSRYAMIGANPSFSSVTVTDKTTMQGDIVMDGDTLDIDMANGICMASNDLSAAGTESTTIGENCEGTISKVTNLEGDTINISGKTISTTAATQYVIDSPTVCLNANDFTAGGDAETTIGQSCDGEASDITNIYGAKINTSGTNVTVDASSSFTLNADEVCLNGENAKVGGSSSTTIGEDCEGNVSVVTNISGTTINIGGDNIILGGDLDLGDAADGYHYDRVNKTWVRSIGQSGTTSTAEKFNDMTNSANGSYSHAEGHGTQTTNEGEHAEGKWNKSNNGSTISSIGIGTSSSDRKNAVEVFNNGDVYINGVGGFSGANTSSANTLQEVLTTMNGHIYNAHGSVTVSISPNIIERDVQKSVSVTNKVQFLGKNYTPQAISVREGSTTGTVISTTANTSTDRTVSASTTYYATVTFIDGVQKTASATVNAYYPMYFGGSAKTTLVSADVLAMAKQTIKNSPNGSYRVNVGQAQYMWLCIPSAINKSITVKSNGFGVPMQSAAQVSVSGKGTYYCYRSSSTYNAGEISIEIS